MSRFLAGSRQGHRERKEREDPPETWWWESAKLCLVTGGCVVSVVLGMFWFFECHGRQFESR